MSSIFVSDGVLRSTDLTHVDAVTIRADATLDAPNLVCVTGKVTIHKGAKFHAPLLREVDELALWQTSLVASALERITKDLFLEEGGKLSAQKLRQIDGEVKIYHSAELAAGELGCVGALEICGSSGRLAVPKLTTVSRAITLCSESKILLLGLQTTGRLQLDQTARLLATQLVSCGDIYMEKGAVITAPLIERASTIYLSAGSSLELPRLVTIDGDLGLGDRAKLTVKSLKEINGDVDFGDQATVTCALPMTRIAVSGDCHVSSGMPTGREWVQSDDIAVFPDPEIEAPENTPARRVRMSA